MYKGYGATTKKKKKENRAAYCFVWDKSELFSFRYSKKKEKKKEGLSRILKG